MRKLTNQDAEGKERQITENWGWILEETRLPLLGGASGAQSTQSCHKEVLTRYGNTRHPCPRVGMERYAGLCAGTAALTASALIHPGLEPGISGSGGRRPIQKANGPNDQASRMCVRLHAEMRWLVPCVLLTVSADMGAPLLLWLD